MTAPLGLLEKTSAYLQYLVDQFAAVELDQFGSLSLVVRVEPPIVRVGQEMPR